MIIIEYNIIHIIAVCFYKIWRRSLSQLRNT